MGAYVEALVCSGVGKPFEPQTVVLGGFRDDEIVVRMVATGICHTDYACANGAIPVPFPFVGGHEGAGVVEQVGASVSHVAPGDHVLLSFSSCGECLRCRAGTPAYCAQMRQQNFKGSRLDGTTSFSLPAGSAVASHFFGQSSFAAKAVVRGRSAVSVDKALPLEVACSFGCGVQTGAGTVLNVLKPVLGSSIAIFGAGAVGMAAIIAAGLTPVAKIIAVDVVDSKLTIARHMGATDVINANKCRVVDEIRRLTAGQGVDRALDATGRISTIQSMFECASPGALVVTVGAPAMGQTLEIEPAKWLEKGVSYMGVHQGSSVPSQFITHLVNFWKAGRFPIDKLIKTYPYQDIEKAHQDLATGSCVKAVLLWQ